MSEMTTALGRKVDDRDWIGFHSDTVLSVLYESHASAFNPNDLPTEIAALSNATGLAPPELTDLLERLVTYRLIEPAEHNGATAYRITPSGTRVVLDGGVGREGVAALALVLEALEKQLL